MSEIEDRAEWWGRVKLRLFFEIHAELAKWDPMAKPKELTNLSQLLAERITAVLADEQEALERTYRQLMADQVAQQMANVIRDAHRTRPQTHPQGFTAEGWRRLQQRRRERGLPPHPGGPGA